MNLETQVASGVIYVRDTESGNLVHSSLNCLTAYTFYALRYSETATVDGAHANAQAYIDSILTRIQEAVEGSQIPCTD